MQTLRPLCHDPLLQLDQLDVQLLQLPVVLLVGQLLAGRRASPRLSAAALAELPFFAFSLGSFFAFTRFFAMANSNGGKFRSFSHYP